MNFNNTIQKAFEILEYPLFTINQAPVSLLSLMIFVFIILLFIFFAKLVKNKLLNRVLNRFGIEEGLQFTFTRLSQYALISLGVVLAFQFIGINLSGLAVVLGFLSVGIGFGLQNVTSNFIAGLILLFERPIKVGDRVSVGNTEGDVENINIRSTTIRSLNNISIIVPNSDFISSLVINWSHGDEKIRVDLDVGVSYDSDLDLVLRVLKEVALENTDILKEPEPEVHFREFGDSSWNLKLRVWILNPKRHYYVRSDLNCAIVRKFREHNIEIPYPQRDLHLRSSNVKLSNDIHD
ncbi:MAG: mechanosensitive ion channel [Bacteroidetes bacterium]|nr:mechanosensitive ion channel [Bacteroidota bacterium]MBU1677705.1 mechanosensitive ion channel [Bacteroidota bacterium]MBU2506682.1 mechanosensitive ion channel [Bacteroidota bacterium]